MSKPSAPFVFHYSLNAPKELVFNSFSTAEALNAWWGPAETSNSVVSLDFRPGGTFHFKMEAGDYVSFGRFKYIDIRPHDFLSFTNAFADAGGNVVKAPFDMEFPLEILYEITLTEQDGKTQLTLTGTPFEATEEQTATFKSIEEDMQRGFAGTFDKLAAYLK